MSSGRGLNDATNPCFYNYYFLAVVHLHVFLILRFHKEAVSHTKLTLFQVQMQNNPPQNNKKTPQKVYLSVFALLAVTGNVILSWLVGMLVTLGTWGK